MATETWAGPLGELRAASTTGGGTALTTTPVFVQLPKGATHLVLDVRNFSTAVVAQVALNPFLIVFKTADNLATSTDYSEAAQDGSTSTDVVLSSLGTAAQQDYLYVGAFKPFRGVSIDVDAANGTASVVTVNYWNGAWTSTSATDGTASGGASLAVDGTVTWTLPTDWVAASLVTIDSPTPAAGLAYAQMALYWTRWQFSGGLDSSTTLNSLLAMNRSTAYWEMPEGRALQQTITWGVGPNGVGCIEARTDAGTANLIVNIATRYGLGF